jgi:hypothetical protein
MGYAKQIKAQMIHCLSIYNTENFIRLNGDQKQNLLSELEYGDTIEQHAAIKIMGIDLHLLAWRGVLNRLLC